MRSSYWVRWPGEDGPLWAAVHLHDDAVVGVELWSEPPGDGRAEPGPVAGALPTDPYPHAPLGVSGAQLRSLGLQALLARLPAGVPQTALRGYGPDHWRAVAQLAQATLARGDRRTALAVAATWSVSRSTAKKWLARCRADGLLQS